MKDTPWDHGLRITAEADGLAGHAGVVLLRKLADQAGPTDWRAGIGADAGGQVPDSRPRYHAGVHGDGGRAGATGMSDIALLADQELVLGAAPGDTTVRRTLELADPRTLDKVARAGPGLRGRLAATSARQIQAGWWKNS
jgi:hypothetical protein